MPCSEIIFKDHWSVGNKKVFIIESIKHCCHTQTCVVVCRRHHIKYNLVQLQKCTTPQTLHDYVVSSYQGCPILITQLGKEIQKNLYSVELGNCWTLSIKAPFKVKTMFNFLLKLISLSVELTIPLTRLGKADLRIEQVCE